jgi:hypothetical protein
MKKKKKRLLMNEPGVSKYSLISSSLSAVCAILKKKSSNNVSYRSEKEKE